jgi:LuxR family transcriptional regulator, maltose regulon positive regulatory protein
VNPQVRSRSSREIVRIPEAGAGPGFELIEGKLRPPPVRSGSVFRTSLLDRMRTSSSQPLVAVSAGAGYGKTTLLAQWADGDPRPFGWISVDGRDNDPVVLLTYAAVALQRLIPIDSGVFDALRSPAPAIIGSAVPRLGAALAAAGVPLVLVLDDVQNLQDPECLDAVSALGAAFPPGSQLALVGRAIPDLGLPRLRAQGLVVDVGVKDLQLGPTEAATLLRAAGADLPETDVEKLVDKTEGWAAGLYLAALFVTAGGSRHEAIRTFSGREQFVADYLNSELLARLSPADVRFLTRTSVLGRLSPDLCDAVLRARGSARMLDRLERSNLFVLPLDADRESYRYHHLFRDLLRSELQRREPDLVPTLIGRAAEWCEAYGSTDEAMDYAQEAGDVERVARLFVGQAQSTYGTGRAVTVERWLEWLDRHGAAERNSAVGVLGAWLCTLGGKPAEADRWAIAAERGSYQGALPDGSPSIDAWLALLSAVRCQAGVDRMLVDAERAVGSIPRASSWWPIALLLVGISRLLSGDTDDADDLFADAAEAAVHVGGWNAAIVAFAERAVIAIEANRWVEAAQLAESALSLIRDHRVEDYPTSGLAHAVSARVALHRAKGDEARTLLGRAQRLRPLLTYALPHLSVQTRLELVRAYRAIGDPSGSRVLLREVGDLLRRQPNLGTLSTQAKALESMTEGNRVTRFGASTLTAAELRLLPYLPTHLSFREIGERLYVSSHTVKSQAISIYRKLGVTSRSAAIEHAGRLGLL